MDTLSFGRIKICDKIYSSGHFRKAGYKYFYAILKQLDNILVPRRTKICHKLMNLDINTIIYTKPQILTRVCKLSSLQSTLCNDAACL